MLANCCHVESYTIEMYGQWNNLAQECQFNSGFVHLTYTHNTAACYHNDVNVLNAFQ